MTDVTFIRVARIGNLDFSTSQGYYRELRSEKFKRQGRRDYPLAFSYGYGYGGRSIFLWIWRSRRRGMAIPMDNCSGEPPAMENSFHAGPLLTPDSLMDFLMDIPPDFLMVFLMAGLPLA